MAIPLKQRNLRNEERRALRKLKSEGNIVIIRADKKNLQSLWREPTTVTRFKKCARTECLYTNHREKWLNPTLISRSVNGRFHF